METSLQTKFLAHPLTKWPPVSMVMSASGGQDSGDVICIPSGWRQLLTVTHSDVRRLQSVVTLLWKGIPRDVCIPSKLKEKRRRRCTVFNVIAKRY